MNALLTTLLKLQALDFDAAGDHKIVWELNRHQHWILLAQAWLLTGRSEYLDEVWREFESWIRENPFQCGMNWTSALEVAFRALSWIWVYHLAGAEMPESVRQHIGAELEERFDLIFKRLDVTGTAAALPGRTIGAHLVARRGDDAARARAADDHGPAFQGGVVALLDGRVERVHVHVQDPALGCCGHGVLRRRQSVSAV